MTEISIRQVGEEWKGRTIQFRYHTTHYYDLEVETLTDGVRFTLQRKPFDNVVKKSFDSNLFSDHLIEPQVFVAERDGHLMGVLELSVEDWANRLRIANIWVTEGGRRQGLGKRLMAKAVAVAREQKRRGLVLETQTCNDPAIQFYQACGFRVIGFDCTHYSNEDIARKEVRLEMGLDLEEGAA